MKRAFFITLHMKETFNGTSRPVPVIVIVIRRLPLPEPRNVECTIYIQCIIDSVKKSTAPCDMIVYYITFYFSYYFSFTLYFTLKPPSFARPRPPTGPLTVDVLKMKMAKYGQ